MKTVMKKLLSLALVAILLVSAVPFQAKADDTIKVPVSVYVNDVFTSTKDIPMNPSDVKKLTPELGMSLLDVTANRTFDKWVATVPGDLDYEWLSDEANFTSYQLSLYIIETVKPEHEHTYQKKETASTCKDAGSIVYTCTECGHTYSETLPLADHTWGDWSEAVKATATTAGKKVRTCSVCGATEEEAIPATGVTTYTVTFIADGETIKTETWEAGQTVPTLPTAPKKSNYQFKGWYTGKNANGDKLEKGDKWDGTTTYYAYYKEDSTGTKDGMSTLTVRMRLYTGSNQTQDVILFTQELEDDTYILSWLQNNTSKVREAVYSKVSDAEYEWIDRVFYDNDSKAELTSQATLADGDKVVFVKVHALDSKETNVQLYIHKYDSKNKVYNTLKIVDVGGYKAGDTIKLSQMATIVKKYYSYSSIKGLYTDTAWKQMINGQNPTASSSITVSGDGTVKYHVLLNGASAASTSTADKTNPKTGDMILVPVMVMVASAAAAAFVYMNSKKRAVR